jgi:DNA helicase-2/ATP-dependent DNA helicase PcrA
MSGVGSAGVVGTGWSKRGDRRGTFGMGSGGRVYGGKGARADAAAVSKSPKPPTDSFEVGELVDHKAFGRGRVIEVNGDQLAIRFERTGETKKLLVGYAPIVKIKQ